MGAAISSVREHGGVAQVVSLRNLQYDPLPGWINAPTDAMNGRTHTIGRLKRARSWCLAVSLAVLVCLSGACADSYAPDPAGPTELHQAPLPTEVGAEAVWNADVEYEVVGASVLATFDVTIKDEGASATGVDRPLFQAPDTLRPDNDHVREVTVRTETADGTSTTGEQRATVQVRISADGNAYLIHRLPDSDDFPIRIRGTVVYPAAGASPAVCARTSTIQRAILSELRKLGYRRDYGCQDVGWQDLAAIRSLEFPPKQFAKDYRLPFVGQVDDLAGLVHLNRARLFVRADEVGGGMFAHTPNLATLDLILGAKNSNTVVGNPGFFRHVPYLSTLHLHAHKFHPDILAGAPQLRSLTVRPAGTWGLEDFVIPVDFLAHVPDLETLDLAGMRSLPAELLVNVPRLRILSVRSTVPPHFLRHSRLLTDLELNLGSGSVPDKLLAPVPDLQRLRVTAGELPPGMLSGTQRLTDLYLSSFEVPEGFLSHAPRLERLELSGLSHSRPMSIPSNALRGLHGLTNLTIWSPYGLTVSGGKTTGGSTGTAKDGAENFSLPPEWLADTRGLEALSIDFPFTALTFPHSFFANTAALVSLNVKANSVVVSERLLADTRGLRRLILDATFHAPPVDLLASTPDLTALKLSSDTALGRRFFMHVPLLKELDLRMPEPVDSELFSLWPGLERLSLHVDGELPPNLLGDMPSLTHLHLVLSDPMPPELLSHARSLRRLYLAGDSFDYEFDLPELEYLTLVAREYGIVLSENFLKGMPTLQYMDLLWGTRTPGGVFWIDSSSVNLSHAPKLKTIVFGANFSPGSKRCSSLSSTLAAYVAHHYLFNISLPPDGLRDWSWGKDDLVEVCRNSEPVCYDYTC